MKLLIVIPALNEEASIEETITRALNARQEIVASTPVTHVDVTVVSDGSTDATVEKALSFGDQIHLISFAENRGYGAAIQEGWRQSDAELLSFLDADGTCDPRFFVPLCNKLFDDHADVVLGCRLHGASKMPAIRRIGNALFAAMMSLFSLSRVRDTASGMRVVRRASLSKLLPLPDGLHFTPAMSARALLSEGVRIVEIDMPYSERQGESKLSVAKDGLRFLKVILETAFLYQPSRPLGGLGLAGLAIAAALMVQPTLFYIENRYIWEWMIYRFVVSHLAGVAGVLFLSASYLTDKMVRIGLHPDKAPAEHRGRVGGFLNSRIFWLLPAVLMVAGGALVLPSFMELVQTGATYEHWSRFIAMSFLFSVSAVLIVTRAADYVLDLLANQLAYTQSEGRIPTSVAASNDSADDRLSARV